MTTSRCNWRKLDRAWGRSSKKALDMLLIFRRTPVRFDLCVGARCLSCRMNYVGHQIRQDIWRALQNLRRFLPVVEIGIVTDNLSLRAGGQLTFLVNLVSAEERPCTPLHDSQIRTRCLHFAAIKAEVVRC